MDEADRRKPKNLEKICSSGLSPTTDPSWTGLRLNLEIQNKRALNDWLTVFVVVVVIGGGVGGGGSNVDDSEEEEEEEWWGSCFWEI